MANNTRPSIPGPSHHHFNPTGVSHAPVPMQVSMSRWTQPRPPPNMRPQSVDVGWQGYQHHPIHPVQVPVPDPIPNPGPSSTDLLAHNITSRIMDSLTPLLSSHHQSTQRVEARMAGMLDPIRQEIEGLKESTEERMKAIEERHSETIKSIAQFLKKSFEIQRKEMQEVVERVKRVERLFCGEEEEEREGLIQTLNNVSYGVDELLERFRDPNALDLSEDQERTRTRTPEPQNQTRPVVRHEMGVSPIRPYVHRKSESARHEHEEHEHEHEPEHEQEQEDQNMSVDANTSAHLTSQSRSGADVTSRDSDLTDHLRQLNRDATIELERLLNQRNREKERKSVDMREVGVVTSPSQSPSPTLTPRLRKDIATSPIVSRVSVPSVSGTSRDRDDHIDADIPAPASGSGSGPVSRSQTNSPCQFMAVDWSRNSGSGGSDSNAGSPDYPNPNPDENVPKATASYTPNHTQEPMPRVFKPDLSIEGRKRYSALSSTGTLPALAWSPSLTSPSASPSRTGTLPQTQIGSGPEHLFDNDENENEVEDENGAIDVEVEVVEVPRAEVEEEVGEEEEEEQEEVEQEHVPSSRTPSPLFMPPMIRSPSLSLNIWMRDDGDDDGDKAASGEVEVEDEDEDEDEGEGEGKGKGKGKASGSDSRASTTASATTMTTIPTDRDSSTVSATQSQKSPKSPFHSPSQNPKSPGLDEEELSVEQMVTMIGSGSGYESGFGGSSVPHSPTVAGVEAGYGYGYESENDFEGLGRRGFRDLDADSHTEGDGDEDADVEEEAEADADAKTTTATAMKEHPNQHQAEQTKTKAIPIELEGLSDLSSLSDEDEYEYEQRDQDVDVDVDVEEETVVGVIQSKGKGETKSKSKRSSPETDSDDDVNSENDNGTSVRLRSKRRKLDGNGNEGRRARSSASGSASQQSTPKGGRQRRSQRGVAMKEEYGSSPAKYSSGPGPSTSASTISGGGSGTKRKRTTTMKPANINSTTNTPASARYKKNKTSKSKKVVVWPKLVEGARPCDMILCDFCNLLFHYGCVGFKTNDPRLENGEEEKWACPGCVAGKPLPRPESTKTEQCSRPGCEIKDEQAFFVERLIGRRTKVTGGVGKEYLYLIRWADYPVSKATWEPTDAFDHDMNLLQKFLEDAKEEGIDIDVDSYSTILLKEAVEGGWRIDEPDLIPSESDPQ